MPLNPVHLNQLPRRLRFVFLLLVWAGRCNRSCLQRFRWNLVQPISKETRKYLATVPNRFDFIFTPTHGSWLNIIESLFAKMTKTFLRGIRVNSKNELKQRILKWVEELNEAPVVFRWKWGIDKISLYEKPNSEQRKGYPFFSSSRRLSEVVITSNSVLSIIALQRYPMLTWYSARYNEQLNSNVIQSNYW